MQNLSVIASAERFFTWPSEADVKISPIVIKSWFIDDLYKTKRALFDISSSQALLLSQKTTSKIR